MSGSIRFSESEMARRVPLAEQVPLDKPFAVDISPCILCNFRCEFCGQSVPELRKSFQNTVKGGLMDFTLFQKVVDDIADAFGRVKQVLLVGRGEPLMHPRIADMVSYLSERQVAERIEITTNGSLLTHELSDKLIAAGLTRLRISVDGLSDEDFRKHCGAGVDFKRYVEQIRYFYTHRKDTSVYVKIINYMVSTPERRDLFYRIFEPICDIINVENLIAMDTGIDYQKLAGEAVSLTATQFSPEFVQSEICSQPFYFLLVQENGDVWPCCGPMLSTEGITLGNVRETSLKDLWEKKSLLFQRRLLDGVKGMPVCEGCSSLKNRLLPEDVLDGAAERLKVEYDTKIRQIQGEQP